MDALFTLNTPTKTRSKRRPAPDPQPRLTKTPRWTTCTCGAQILEALGDGLMETQVDPTNLTPTGIRTCLILHRPIYRSPLGINNEPTELWITYPDDLAYYQHHHYYWLPQHQCGTPPLPHTALTIRTPKTNPKEPPY